MRRNSWLVLSAVVATAVAGFLLGRWSVVPEPTSLAPRSYRLDLTEARQQLEQVRRRSAGSVVAVLAERETVVPGGIRRATGNGSGFVISDAGLILTNQHVIADADRIEIVDASGRSHQARLVGQDPRSDLAVLHANISAPPLEFGRGGALGEGELVAAMGNPLGLSSGDGMLAFVPGWVSRVGVHLPELAADDRMYTGMIQVTASLHRGCSGGPLMNMEGKVIGVITAMGRRGDEAEGGQEQSPFVPVGFAVPISPWTRSVIHRLEAGAEIRYGWLGLDPGGAVLAGRESIGVTVRSVQLGGPAEDAGIIAGDIITQVDGRPVTGPEDYLLAEAQAAIGAPAEVVLRRNGGAERVQVEVFDRRHRLEGPAGDYFQWRGARFTEFSRAGAMVLSVDPGSPADAAGLMSGTVVVTAAGMPVAGPRQLREAVRGRGGAVVLTLQAGEDVTVESAPAAQPIILDE